MRWTRKRSLHPSTFRSNWCMSGSWVKPTIEPRCCIHHAKWNSAMSSTLLNRRSRVYGAGLIALDIVITPDDRAARTYAGGTCGNVLTILSYLGWESFPIARLNGDAVSARVLADLHRWNVR